MLFFRFRVLLEITHAVPKLYPVHGPLIYALLSEAYGVELKTKPVLPAGLTPLAVEQLRIHLAPGDQYAFGMSLFSESEQDASEVLEQIWRGLERIGTRQAARRQTFDGNFRVAEVFDLFGRRVMAMGTSPQPLDQNHVLREVEQLANLSRVSLRFVTPLRWQRPGPLKTDANKHLDRQLFLPDLFLKRLPGRLKAVGLDISGAPSDLQLQQARLVENRLVWLDVDYRKARKRGMRLGGAVGRVVIDLPPNYPRHWLVWGQYTQVGESTRFDHGRYRIEELGPDGFACHRSRGLVDLALDSPNLDLAVQSVCVASGECTRAAEEIRLGQYEPPASQTAWIESVGKAPRRLLIPPRVDRALQRAVHQLLAPALDGLFESSSFAYRHGLSRYAAARRIQSLYNNGYRWAIQADFESFFDSISHAELADRMHAYISDPPMESLLLRWVVRSDPDHDGKGIPTGFPISPLLGNLMLDRFDELIEQGGGRLVRYADDFLILFRQQDQADRLWKVACKAAESLSLTLNDAKTSVRDLTEPFVFLGFQFQKRDCWHHAPIIPPCHIDELGWIDRGKQRAGNAPRVTLTGESTWQAPSGGPMVLVDSDAVWIGVERGRLLVRNQQGKTTVGPDLDGVQQLLVIGPASLDRSLVTLLAGRPIVLVMCDASGRTLFESFPDNSVDQSELVGAQVHSNGDDGFRLDIARILIEAKLKNYAVVSETYPDRKPREPIGDDLRRLADAASRATTIDQLLGYEGAGAAQWYRTLNGRIPSKFWFRKRVAPRAEDPINVMLNIAQTHLYRQARIAARLVGLQPSIGVLHRPASGFSPLAADLQEPFRMLMDRAVIEASFHMCPADFTRNQDGPFPLQMAFVARRRLLATIHGLLQTVVQGTGGNDPASYQVQLLRTARSLRRRLLSGKATFSAFQLQRPRASAARKSRDG